MGMNLKKGLFGKGRQFRLSVLFLCTFLALAQPRPAVAQWIVSDPTVVTSTTATTTAVGYQTTQQIATAIATEAALAAHWVLEGYEWADINGGLADIADAVHLLGEENFDATTGGSQSIVHALELERKAISELQAGAETMVSPGSILCVTTYGAAAREAARGTQMAAGSIGQQQRMNQGTGAGAPEANSYAEKASEICGNILFMPTSDLQFGTTSSALRAACLTKTKP